MKNIIHTIFSVLLIFRGFKSKASPDIDTHKLHPSIIPQKTNIFFKKLFGILILIILIFATIASIHSLNLKSVSTPPLGSINIVTRGNPAITEVECDIIFDSNRNHTWSCEAGLLPLESRPAESQVNPEEISYRNNGRTDVLIYAMDSNVKIIPLDRKKLTKSEIKHKVGYYKPGFGEGVKIHKYDAVAFAADDIRNCSGTIIYNSEYSGPIPYPNNCAIEFNIEMPKTSVGVSSNQVSFASPMFTTAGQQAKGQPSSPGGDVEYILLDMGIITERDHTSPAGSFSLLRVNTMSTPQQWLPSATYPTPIQERAGFSYPSWETTGGSKEVFQIVSTGTIPPNNNANFQLILSTILGSLVSALIATIFSFNNSKK